MKKVRIAFVGVVAAATLAGCGGGNAERDKSASDVAQAVRVLQDAMKEETAAVKTGNAHDEIENVQLVAQVEHERLAKLAQRAPAETQDFADAAELWSKAVLTSRTAILERVDESTSAAAILNIRLSAKAMDAEAAKLHVDPWLKLDQY
ncbi:hypothetical protein ACIHCX_10735 [Streptomyces sp. NPDC052043]|uniref:hypothetical protein n=1 Tax=Streptomyces sp. NPDC052043 TaxID=3365684 RepID=UPI0037D53685